MALIGSLFFGFFLVLISLFSHVISQDLRLKNHGVWNFLTSVKDAVEPTTASTTATDEEDEPIVLEAMFKTMPVMNASALNVLAIEAPAASATVTGKPAKLTPYIVNGSPVPKGMVPSAAAIIVDGTMFCGGSLITATHIITAGHCVAEAKTFVVSVGNMRLPPSNEEGVITRTSTSAVHHPDYNPATLQNDIALIAIASVEKHIDNFQIGLAKLPTTSNNNYTGLQCNVSGWGLNKSPLEGGALLSTLNYVTLEIYEFTFCKEFFLLENGYKAICAGSRTNKSTCQGDSGGPYVCKMSGSNVQVGIVSFGGPSCTRNNPLVFTDIQKYMSWINRTTQNLRPTTQKAAAEKPFRVQGKMNKGKKPKRNF